MKTNYEQHMLKFIAFFDNFTLLVFMEVIHTLASCVTVIKKREEFSTNYQWA